jgi:predicted 3-demethylubiquinone-9 3-methyltransferase (glyoxalase superfamily)
MQCGWLTDRFGVSWQVVPSRLGELMGAGDVERANRVMQAVLRMVKFDIGELEVAAAG